MPCVHGYDGEAVVQIRDGQPEWVRADERICVSTELLANDDARVEIEKRYRVGEPCDGNGIDARHATRGG